MGADGDYYFDTMTDELYGPKAGGAWGGVIADLTGAAGAPGATDSLIAVTKSFLVAHDADPVVNLAAVPCYAHGVMESGQFSLKAVMPSAAPVLIENESSDGKLGVVYDAAAAVGNPQVYLREADSTLCQAGFTGIRMFLCCFDGRTVEVTYDAAAATYPALYVDEGAAPAGLFYHVSATGVSRHVPTSSTHSHMFAS